MKDYFINKNKENLHEKIFGNFIELYNEQALPEVSKTIQYGVPLYEVVEALGTDMYASSQGTNKPLETLLHSHRQQAYLELTDKAREYLESKFRE